jgi:hypothetical protein
LTELQKQSYSLPYATTGYASNAGTLTINPDAPELFIDGAFLYNQADADLLRDSIVARVGTRRDLFEITIVSPLFVIAPGMVVKIFYDRFGLSAGRNGEVLSIVENADATTLQVLMVQ